LYALDGTAKQNLPYTVTEQIYSVREEVSPSDSKAKLAVFFPVLLAERTTQWERGNDPLTVFSFTNSCDANGQPLDYDKYGQLFSTISVAVPRGVNFQSGGAQSYLATQSVSTYISPAVAAPYIADRVSSVTKYELVNDGSLPVAQFVQQV